MKKVLALVLAVMMLSTMAFAVTLKGTAEGGDVIPGDKIKLTRDASDNSVEINNSNVTLQFEGDVYGWADSSAVDADERELDAALTEENYRLGKIRYNEGKSLIDDIYLDDEEEEIVIAFNRDYNYAKAKDFDVEIDIDGKSRDIDDISVRISGTVGYQHFILGLDDDDFDLMPTLDNDNLKNGVVEFKEDGESYSTMVYDIDDLSMEVRVYDGDEFYLYCDTSADVDVLKANADVDGDLYFYNFKGEPTFNSTAKLYFYNADEDCYVYEIDNGRLTEVGKYDDDEGCWVVRARTLGQYVVSTEELVNADGEEVTEPDVDNPDTGANDVVGIAAALGVVALVSAAAVSLKK